MFEKYHLSENAKIITKKVPGDEDNIKKICEFLNLNVKESYPLSCDDAYVDLCRKKGIKPKDHILFDDSDMPKIN